MTKFKVGDKVQVLDNSGGSKNPIGSKGIISLVCEKSNDCRVVVEGVTDNNLVNWHQVCELELVTE